jgi:hypothetical protein
LLLVAMGVAGLVVAGVGLAGGFDDDEPTALARQSKTGSRLGSGGADAETPEAFFEKLSTAIRDRDSEFLFERLHPFVIDRYGDAACRAYLGQLAVPAYDAHVAAVGASGRWDWSTDNLTRSVLDATTVQLRTTNDGVSFREAEGHVVVGRKVVSWFTDCGTPLPGGR